MPQNHDLFDATDGEEEITAEHTPDPQLLHNAAIRSEHPLPLTNRQPRSGISRVRRSPPPPPPRPPSPSIRMVPLARMRALLARFTEDAGPAARPIMLQALDALQATPDRFPLLLCGELITALSSRLDDSETRERFVIDAQRITLENSDV